MSTLDAIMTIEGDNGSPTEDEAIAAFQVLIDDGVVWSLQGHYGRTANWLIEQGMCTPKGK